MELEYITSWLSTDKRTDGWFLADSPLTPVLGCLTYLLVVKVLGPRFMKDRPSFQLRNVLMIYNLFQIVFNGWMFYHVCRLTWFNGYSFICQPVDYSNSSDALQQVLMGYCFYVSKLIDFLDTIFFILRKKNNQITFLHVFHHFVMALTCFIGFRFMSGGQSALTPTINTLVHCVMYFYYLLAAMGPRFQKYLWWKRHLTVLQMIQFICIALHGMMPFIYDCGFPKIYCWFAVAQSIMFLQLFKDFHSKTYRISVVDNNVNNNKLK